MSLNSWVARLKLHDRRIENLLRDVNELLRGISEQEIDKLRADVDELQRTEKLRAEMKDETTAMLPVTYEVDPSPECTEVREPLSPVQEVARAILLEAGFRAFWGSDNYALHNQDEPEGYRCTYSGMASMRTGREHGLYCYLHREKNLVEQGEADVRGGC